MRGLLPILVSRSLRSCAPPEHGRATAQRGTIPDRKTIWPSVRKGVQLINAFVRDLSERRALESQLADAEASLARLRREDPLTGLPNRQALKDDLARSISFARRWKQPLALLVADLDGFRAINDQIAGPSPTSCCRPSRRY